MFLIDKEGFSDEGFDFIQLNITIARDSLDSTMFCRVINSVRDELTNEILRREG